MKGRQECERDENWRCVSNCCNHFDSRISSSARFKRGIDLRGLFAARLGELWPAAATAANHAR